jgi:hypothetical protein
MNAIHRLFSLFLCALTAMLWLLANAYAQSNDTKTCAILADTFTPHISPQITPADQLHQMIQSKIYAACLQAHSKQGASRMTAPGQAGTNTTNAGAFVTFDVPGATGLTQPEAINPAGTVAGYFADAGGVYHSFLRTSDGTITPFGPPYAIAVGITPDGTIVGSSLGRGYLRAPNGTITIFSAPFFHVSTIPTAINPAGVVTGFFGFPNLGDSHGFLRAPNGTFTTFDPLGSTFTQPEAINPAGTVTGQYADIRSFDHGFLRTSDGTITAFDPPGSLFTFPAAINPAGTIVGSFLSPNFQTSHGFLRAPNGTITVFDPPGSLSTVPQAITPGGAIVGSYFTGDPGDFSAAHGFLRAPNGTVTVFDPPGSRFTYVSQGAMNPAGTVTGNFTVDLSAFHGFVGRPDNTH